MTYRHAFLVFLYKKLMLEFQSQWLIVLIQAAICWSLRLNFSLTSFVLIFLTLKSIFFLIVAFCLGRPGVEADVRRVRGLTSTRPGTSTVTSTFRIGAFSSSEYIFCVHKGFFGLDVLFVCQGSGYYIRGTGSRGQAHVRLPGKLTIVLSNSLFVFQVN